jgi:nucleoside-specific outer membrane channel protein Tsx
MFSRILKVGLLAGCLVVASTASAAERNVVVPVLAGAAVGAVLIAVLANASDDDHRHRPPRHYHQPPRHHGRYARQVPRAVKPRPKRVEYVVVERRDWRGGHR